MSYDNFPYYPNYQKPTNQYVFVNGVEGAKAYNLMPNQTILLMDNDNPYVYMKTSNQLGQTSLRYFKLVEINEQEAKGIKDDYVSKAELDEIKAKLDKLMEEKKDA